MVISLCLMPFRKPTKPLASAAYGKTLDYDPITCHSNRRLLLIDIIPMLHLMRGSMFTAAPSFTPRL